MQKMASLPLSLLLAILAYATDGVMADVYGKSNTINSTNLRNWMGFGWVMKNEGPSDYG